MLRVHFSHWQLLKFRVAWWFRTRELKCCDRNPSPGWGSSQALTGPDAGKVLSRYSSLSCWGCDRLVIVKGRVTDRQLARAWNADVKARPGPIARPAPGPEDGGDGGVDCTP